MRRLTQVVLMGVLVLAVASMAAAQAPVPGVRLGNYIEVGNEVFMRIIALADIRYQTVHNLDFEDKVRDRVASRNPMDTREQSGDYDGLWNIIRFGVDFKYQKNLTAQIVLESRPDAEIGRAHV